jgi:hypothetical protein
MSAATAGRVESELLLTAGNAEGDTAVRSVPEGVELLQPNAPKASTAIATACLPAVGCLRLVRNARTRRCARG